MHFSTSAPCAILLAAIPMQSYAVTIQTDYSDYFPLLKDLKCEKMLRCNSQKSCAQVCKKGTVAMDLWAQEALKIQRKLAYNENVCYAQHPGSHNSAITVADVLF